MGKFGCTQIRTSSYCSSEKKKDFLICFLGLENFAQRFNQHFDKNGPKTDDHVEMEKFTQLTKIDVMVTAV